MISYHDIQAVVTKKLQTTGIDVMQTDVKEDIKRPSFFVFLDNMQTTGYTRQVHKFMTVRIYYFPENPHIYISEVLKMQETIADLFDMKLSVKDRFLDIDDLSFDTVDDVLQCSFDVEFYDGRESEKQFDPDKKKYPIKDMENLNIKE